VLLYSLGPKQLFQMMGKDGKQAKENDVVTVKLTRFYKFGFC